MVVPPTTANPRPGGRSARIQNSVHAAVRTLLEEHDRAQLSVPQIAQLAGVTPSTIYRRWGDVHELLADVAVERLRPESAPEDTGSLHGDLTAWMEQFVEEMASPDGRAFTRDAVAFGGAGRPACQCAAYTREQLDTVLNRARDRGEVAPAGQTVVDHVVAPLMYRILFTAETPGLDDARALVDTVLERCADRPDRGGIAE